MSSTCFWKTVLKDNYQFCLSLVVRFETLKDNYFSFLDIFEENFEGPFVLKITTNEYCFGFSYSWIINHQWYHLCLSHTNYLHYLRHSFYFLTGHLRLIFRPLRHLMLFLPVQLLLVLNVQIFLDLCTELTLTLTCFLLLRN